MFSVIIPVYNGATFIDTAIESVFKQSFTDWEIVIVNDGSSDNTADVLKKYEADPRITVYTQDNAGVSIARNNGITASKGSHIVFLDADDVWHNNHLEVMYSLIKKYPDAGMYGTFTRTELVNGEIIEECNYFKNRDTEVYTKDFFKEYYLDKSAKMFTVITTCFSRNALDVAGLFSVGCAIGEDLELSLRVAAYFPVVLSPKATATYKKVNSTATKDRSFDPDWKFFDSVNELYEDNRISNDKKENLKKIMQWFTMRRSRHYIIDGRKKDAYCAYKNIGNDPRLRKDKLITAILLILPVCFVKWLFLNRWRGRA